MLPAGKDDMKKDFLLVFYLIAGVIIGSLLAAVSLNVQWLSWLAFGIDIGFGYPSPALLDLAVLQLSFGVRLSITVAHVLSIGLAISLYNRKGGRR